jgi:hypothetical protein
MFQGELFIDANQSYSVLVKELKKIVIVPDMVVTYCTYVDSRTFFLLMPRSFYSWELETYVYDETLMKDVEW